MIEGDNAQCATGRPKASPHSRTSPTLTSANRSRPTWRRCRRCAPRRMHRGTTARRARGIGVCGAWQFGSGERPARGRAERHLHPPARSVARNDTRPGDPVGLDSAVPCPLPSPEALPDARHALRNPALQPGRLVARVARRGATGRPARVRPPLGVGPPVRDLRRSLPGLLRGLLAAGRVGARDQASSPRPARRREHLPQPGDRRQDDRDDRPHQRRPGDRRPRRRLDGAGAHRPRHRLRFRVRPAARLDGRGDGCDPEAARRGDGDVRAGWPLRVQGAPPPPAAGPAAPADHDRRLRREEDAPLGRALRRYLERDGHGRLPAPQDRGAQAALLGRRARSRRDHVHARHQGDDPRQRRPKRIASGARTWSTTGRRWPTSRTT